MIQQLQVIHLQIKCSRMRTVRSGEGERVRYGIETPALRQSIIGYCASAHAARSSLLPVPSRVKTVSYLSPLQALLTF